LRLLYLF